MPRMLSLWLDFGAGVVEQEKKERIRQTTTASSQGLEKLRMTLKTLNKVAGGGDCISVGSVPIFFPDSVIAIVIYLRKNVHKYW